MIHNKGAPRSSCALIPIAVIATVVTMGACNASQPPPLTPASSTAQAIPERYGATLMQPSDKEVARIDPTRFEDGSYRIIDYDNYGNPVFVTITPPR
jgi:hypothetical protein